MTITATFETRRPWRGTVTSGSEEKGVLSARGPRGGGASYARNIHSGRWSMVTVGGTQARTDHVVSLEVA